MRKKAKIILKLLIAAGLLVGLLSCAIYFLNSKTDKDRSGRESAQPTRAYSAKRSHSSPEVRSTITVSSNAFPGDKRFAPEFLMQEGRTVWHAEIPPTYPQWVEISFSEPVLVTHLGIRSQEDGRTGTEYSRGPRNFVLQGSNDSDELSNVPTGRTWQFIHKVDNNIYTKGGEWKDWFFSNRTAFRSYRIYIKAGGDRDYLTIRQIRLDSASKLSEGDLPKIEDKNIVPSYSAKVSLPSDFDWRNYVESYKDLQEMGIDTKEKAAEHWLKIGRKEGRKYKDDPIVVPEVPYMPWKKES